MNGPCVVHSIWLIVAVVFYIMPLNFDWHDAGTIHVANDQLQLSMAIAVAG
jgi:hypothetical protein